MKCPKCGYYRQPRDHVFVSATECPACGIIYSKYGLADAASTATAVPRTFGPQKTSPVHESSLRQARYRVEMRLQNRKTMLLRDDRKTRTLERARLITDAVMRQRRDASINRKADAEKPLDDTNDEFVMEAAVFSEPSPSMDPLSKFYQDQDQDRCQDQADHVHPTQPLEIESGHPFIEPGEFESFHQEAEKRERERLEHLRDIDAAGEGALPLPPNRFSDFGTPHWGSTLQRMLPVVAWLILCAGLVGAVLSWTTLSDVQAGTEAVPSSVPGVLPVALFLGFAYLAIGVMGFAFFWVASIISTQLKEIRCLLHPDSAEPITTGSPH